MSSADIQKSATGITFSTTSLLLTFTIRHQRLEAAYTVKRFRRASPTMALTHGESMTACMHEGKGASF